MIRLLLFFQCLLMISLESIRVSAQALLASSTIHNVRVVGHGYFGRSCSYSGTNADFFRLEIHLNGTVHPRGGRGRDRDNFVDISISGPTFADSGDYRCSALFSGGIAVRSVSAGSLRVYSTDAISHSPAVVNVAVGGNALLECSTSIPQTYAVWSYSNRLSDFSGVISNAGLKDARQYGCNIIEESRDNIIYTGLIRIDIVVPPKIITEPQVSDIYGDEMVNFTVLFLSVRFYTEIIWLKDSVPIHSGFEVHYQNSTTGTTSLVFDPLTRADEGLYTVRISNNNTLIPSGRRFVTYNFRVNVKVPPAIPSVPWVQRINDSLIRVSWRLTNQTTEAGPETLLLNVTNHPDSPININPPNTEEILLPIEPGVQYDITLHSINRDGSVVSPSLQYSIPPTAPLVTEVAALKVNDSTFNFVVEVLYTGAGSGNLRLVEISFREADEILENWIRLGRSLDLVPNESRWNWHVVVQDERIAQISRVEFSFRIQNILNLEVNRTVEGISVVPGQPHSIKLISVSSTSLTIQAQLSDIGTAPILSAHLSITSPDSTSSLHDVTENLFQGKVLEFVVDGLSSNTTYFVVIYAVNAVGKGQESERMNFTTTVLATSSSSMTGAVIGGISGGLVAVAVLLFVVIIGCCWYHRRERIHTNKHHPPLSTKAGKSSYKRTSRPSEELRQKRRDDPSIGDCSSKGGGISSKGKRPSKGDRPPKSPSKGDGPPKSPSKGDGPPKCPSKGDGPPKRPSKGDGPPKRPSKGDGPPKRPSKGGDGQGDRPSKE